MTVDQLAESIPSYANDLKLNLSSVLRQPELSLSQTWGTAVASAFASGSQAVYDAIRSDAAKAISAETIEAARSAAALMRMNNIYYRFQHLSENDKYAAIPSRLRMNVTRTHGADPMDFELWSLAVSAVNGCGVCIVAHERKLREKGITEEAILAAVRIAAVVSAIAAVFQIEG